MRTNQNTKSVIVGLFIFIALIIFALGIFVLGGENRTFGKTVTAKSTFDNVGGLKRGSNVLFGGVKVGIVKKISLMPENKVLVEMRIEDENRTFIPANANARIASDGLIGSKLVEIYGGALQYGALKDGTVLKSGLSSSMEELFATLQKNNNNLIEITTDLKQISRKILNGEGSMGKLINDPSLVYELQGVVARLKVPISNAQSLTADLANYTSKLQKPGTMTYNLLNDTVVFRKLRSTTRELDAMANNAQAIVNKLNKSADNLSDPTKPAGMILNDKETTADIKQIITNLQNGTEKLSETLDAVQHNFLFRGYFKRKVRESMKDSIQN